MKINRFEDVIAWKEARVLVKMVYEAIKENFELKELNNSKNTIN